MATKSLLSSVSRIRYPVHSHITRSITSASNTGGKFTTDLSAYSSLSHAVTPLNSYGLVKITGKDASTFLQGLVTNDITDASNPNTYNAILAPNGRYLYDCFISQSDNDYLIEAHTNTIPDLIKYLKKYKLRSKVKFEDMSNDYRVWSVLTAPKSLQSMCANLSDNYGHKCYIDPRYNGLGIRMILSKDDIPHTLPNNFMPIGEDFYYALKCMYGIPTHGIELITDETIILESNFFYLNGVSFTKGCYVGQELITRTHHRGQIRKRLFGATIAKGLDTETVTTVKRIINADCDRDTIIPSDIINGIEESAYDYTHRNVIGSSNKVIGKVTSEMNGSNCCIAQLRNNAFLDIKSNDPQSVGLRIEGTDYIITPHFCDYFTQFSDLFAARE